MAGKVNKAGAETGDAFSAMEKKTAATQAKFATFTSKLLGMQLALSAVSGNNGGLGRVGQAMEAAAKGAQVAAAAMHAFQGKISLAGAAALGVGVSGVDFLAQRMREAIEATDAMTAAQIRSRLSLTQLSDGLEDAGKGAAVFGASGLDQAQKKLSILQSTFDGNLKRLREIPEEIAAIRQSLDAERSKPWGFRSDTKVSSLQDQMDSLGQERTNRERTNQDITGGAAGASAAVALRQIGEEAAKASKALSDVREIGARSLELGIAEPAELAVAKLQAAKVRLEAIIQQEIKLRDAAAMPGLTDEKRAEILNQIKSLSTDVGMAQGEFLGAKRTVESQKNLDALADNFGGAFSRSLGEAILSAKTPMAALAQIGGSLFENAINEAMKSVQSGLAAALKAISGGSDVVGGVVSSALGILGGIFSKPGGIDQSFASVRSSMESSVATRGILAGPSNVAIASVGEDLSRAMAPVRDVLGLMLAELRGINRKTGGGPGGLGFGGTVSTT